MNITDIDKGMITHINKKYRECVVKSGYKLPVSHGELKYFMKLFRPAYENIREYKVDTYGLMNMGDFSGSGPHKKLESHGTRIVITNLINKEVIYDEKFLMKPFMREKRLKELLTKEI